MELEQEVFEFLRYSELTVGNIYRDAIKAIRAELERVHASEVGSKEPSCIPTARAQIDVSDNTPSAQARPASNPSQPESVTPCSRCKNERGCLIFEYCKPKDYSFRESA